MAGEKNGKITPVNNTESDKSTKTVNNSKTTTKKSTTNNIKNKSATDNSSPKDNKETTTEMAPFKMELEEMCAIRPQASKLMSGIPCCRHLHHKTSFKVILFLAVVAFEAVDLISDWFLYYHVSATEEGLVYGPPSPSLRYALLAFSIIGSLTFPFEAINLGFEIFKTKPLMDIDLLAAITIWIEDVPQIVINVFIFACREEAISYFQLVKAALVIFGALIRFFVLLVRYCSKNARFDMKCARVNPESRRHVVYRCFIMFGCLMTIVGATAVFLFTQVDRNPDGSLNFKIPNSLIEGEYDDQKYFHNVSVYFSHELFDNGKLQATENINLVRLLTINDIRRSKAEQVVRVQYEQSSGQNKFVIDTTGSVMNSTKCFETNTGTDIVTYATNCSSYIHPTNKREIIFKFKYIKPSIPKLIFGDINYNVKIHEISPVQLCKSLDFTIKDMLDDHLQDSKISALHYFRLSSSPNTDHVLYEAASNTGRFYHSNDLIDVNKVWKTGFTNCKSSGSMAPHYDDSIPIDCN